MRSPLSRYACLLSAALAAGASLLGAWAAPAQTTLERYTYARWGLYGAPDELMVCETTDMTECRGTTTAPGKNWTVAYFSQPGRAEFGILSGRSSVTVTGDSSLGNPPLWTSGTRSGFLDTLTFAGGTGTGTATLYFKVTGPTSQMSGTSGRAQFQYRNAPGGVLDWESGYDIVPGSDGVARLPIPITFGVPSTFEILCYSLSQVSTWTSGASASADITAELTGILVTDAGGTHVPSATVLAESGTPYKIMTVNATSLTPPYGDVAGGTVVTIIGSAFGAGTTVTFGGIVASSISVDSSTQMTCTTPPGTEGVVDVVVRQPSGDSATLVKAYTYSRVLTLAHFAGQITGTRGFKDGKGPEAQFYNPNAIAIDGMGNTYVTDLELRMVTPDGTVTTIANPSLWAVDVKPGPGGNLVILSDSGRSVTQLSPTGDRSVLARFGSSTFYDNLAVDPSGRIYLVSSESGSQIDRLSPDGTTQLLAGSTAASGSADGQGDQARFGGAIFIAADGSGAVWVADNWNSTLRRVDPTGNVTTIAGMPGQHGSADGQGTEARFDSLLGCPAIDPTTGDIVLADSYRIRRVTPAGLVTTVAGTYLWGGSVDGSRDEARLSGPRGTSVDAEGNVIFSDVGAGAVRRVSKDGSVTTVAGAKIEIDAQDLPGSEARFSTPRRSVVGSDGTLFVTDQDNYTVRRITRGGRVSTLAGKPGISGPLPGVPEESLLSWPIGIGLDSAGNVYVGDCGDHTIRKVTPSGNMTIFAGSGVSGHRDGVGSEAQFGCVPALAVDSSGNVFAADYASGFSGIRKIASDGTVTTVVGGAAGSSPGRFRNSRTTGVALDEARGLLYVADTSNRRVSLVDLARGVATVFAGTGAMGSADGPRLAATFYGPTAIAVGPDGSLLVADYGAVISGLYLAAVGAVRRIAGDVVTTVAGGVTMGNRAGSGAEIQFNGSLEVACGPNGEIYVIEPILSTIFGPPCSLPNAAEAVTISSGSVRGGPLTATDPLLVSWSDPSSGSPPHSYEVRINGGSWTRALANQVTFPLTGSLDPVKAYVRCYGCSPTQGPSAEASSPTYALAPPVASFRASKTAVTVGEVVSFTDTSSPQATAWFWFFGDGGFATGQNPQHAFAASGTYGVQLMAVNGSGASVSPVQNVVVNPGATARTEAASQAWFAGQKSGRQEFRSDGRGTLTLESAEEATVYLRFVRGDKLVLERRVALGACEEARLELGAYFPKEPREVDVQVVADRPVAAALEGEVRR